MSFPEPTRPTITERDRAFNAAVIADRLGDEAEFDRHARRWLTLLATEDPASAGCTPEQVATMSPHDLEVAVFG